MRNPTAALVFIFLIFSNWLPTTTKAQKAKDVSALSKTQWREDLQYFARELPIYDSIQI